MVGCTGRKLCEVLSRQMLVLNFERPIKKQAMPTLKMAQNIINNLLKRKLSISHFHMTCFKLDGDYHERAEDAKEVYKALSTYIDYKRCEGVAEIVVAPSMSDGFRGIVQTMGLDNLKPNIVAVVIVNGLDKWPNEYQRHYRTIDLYWIGQDGGLILILSQPLFTKKSFESCKVQVFCIAEEDSNAEELKADVRKYLGCKPSYLAGMKERAQKEKTPLMADGKPVVLNEQRQI
ncbi:Cation-chloride cotransporter 1 [Abeliophyllum distichum]|uniref:Cation-chloride cotransporter 1 n=1 Tax=Abeliophyllum distichum TaxID=126358 RepID=A0ABD1TXE7_9LAMI